MWELLGNLGRHAHVNADYNVEFTPVYVTRTDCNFLLTVASARHSIPVAGEKFQRFPMQCCRPFLPNPAFVGLLSANDQKLRREFRQQSHRTRSEKG